MSCLANICVSINGVHIEHKKIPEQGGSICANVGRTSENSNIVALVGKYCCAVQLGFLFLLKIQSPVRLFGKNLNIGF